MKLGWLYACALSGCGSMAAFSSSPTDRVTHFNPPASMSGPTKVDFSFQAQFDVCELELWPANTPRPGHNWVPSGKPIIWAEGADARLRPGTYQLALVSCDGKNRVGDTLKIERESVVEITYRELIRKPLGTDAYLYVILSPSPAWVFQRANPLVYDPAPGSGPACTPDQSVSVSSGGDCCSGKIHGNPDPRGPSICGPVP